MCLWNKEGVPHKGWKCIDVIDLGEYADGMSYETRKLLFYENCEMCNQEGIRYVHVMEHPEYDGQLRVGCVCAEKMENDYVAPRKREKELRNRQVRRLNFLKKHWVHRANGNMLLKHKGKYITIMHSKYNLDSYCLACDNKLIWEYRGENIRDIRTAKLAAFDVFN